VGCQEDLVREDETGAVFHAGDVSALAEALQRVLGTPGLAVRMGDAARRRIDQFSFEQDVAGLRQALSWCVPGFQAVAAQEESI
jgi:glycosyltransferase involved in cell wall biosynthesis